MVKHVSVAVVLDATRDHILLQKREDFRLWSLPGGMVEADEAYDLAAIREAEEETGLIVEVIRHVADFHRSQTNECVHVYECKAIGGEIIKQGYETLDVDWFPVIKLPKGRMVDTKRYVDATLANLEEVLQETITYENWYVILRSTAIWLRNMRNRYLRR